MDKSEQQLDELSRKLDELKEQSEEITNTISDMLNILNNINKNYPKVSTIKNTLESINRNGLFDFIEELDLEITNLSYNYKKAEKTKNISTYKVVNFANPSFFKRNL